MRNVEVKSILQDLRLVELDSGRTAVSDVLMDDVRCLRSIALSFLLDKLVKDVGLVIRDSLSIFVPYTDISDVSQRFEFSVIPFTTQTLLCLS